MPGCGVEIICYAVPSGVPEDARPRCAALPRTPATSRTPALFPSRIPSEKTLFKHFTWPNKSTFCRGWGSLRKVSTFQGVLFDLCLTKRKTGMFHQTDQHIIDISPSSLERAFCTGNKTHIWWHCFSAVHKRRNTAQNLSKPTENNKHPT